MLRESGLDRRISEAYKSGALRKDNSFTIMDIIPSAIITMQENKLFASIPLKDKIYFFESFQNLYKLRDCPDRSCWCVEMPEQIHTIPLEQDDLLALSGHSMMGLLRQEEFFDYRKFGFSDIFEFTGTVGAAIQHISKSIDEGLKWEITRPRPDGSIFQNIITAGASYGNLIIKQKDFTAYETTDPFGNVVSYRPETDSDCRTASLDHSQEGYMLVAILKYIDQCHLDSKVIGGKQAGFEEWLKSIAPDFYENTNPKYTGTEEDPIHFLVVWRNEIPRLSEDGSKPKRSAYRVVTTLCPSTSYSFYINSKNELVMQYEKQEIDRQPIIFSSEEVDDLLKSLFYSTANRLGRTSLKQLADIVEYGFSEKLLG
jgi:hypothetical protein